ncbi:MAG: KpsF/GutQ family sugar-phosphate isomerase [Candidatus Eisenbacteria bacterium]|uniref:KpsF/GutQ family sugar-phosphate isomerase n=1 Tax=Eiseniibacteriota bacterium TaxID=2212470 RepID=A0A956N9X9_UNCEI|nr:KpsF/GutQ family sugar-phosphate isomerase [Candidatus Eisenbacteria bacterium]
MMSEPFDVAAFASEILRKELAGLETLGEALRGDAFAEVVSRLRSCRGRIVVCGVGKSGHVAQRIAASFRSTGTAAVFLHPTEALHGDLGMVAEGDVGLFLSKSGESTELSALLPAFQRLEVPVVAVVCQAESTLARNADVVLEVGPIEEAGPLTLVPSTSTTIFQVVGDILVACLYSLRGMTEEELSFLHPGGLIGHQATRRVGEIMQKGAALPIITEERSVRDGLVEMIEKRLGMTTVVDEQGRLVGILTDGDVRRMVYAHDSIESLRVGDVMTRNPRTIDAGASVAQAVARMEMNQPAPITCLVVIGADGAPEGVVHLHECLRIGTPRG